MTPGNIGVAGAAAAFALRAHGVDGELAVTVGIAFNAVETLTSIVFGSGCALYLASSATRRAGAGGARRRARRVSRARRSRSARPSCSRSSSSELAAQEARRLERLLGR